MPLTHEYNSQLVWTGNLGSGTARLTDYERSHTVQVEGKPVLQLTAGPAFRGNPAVHDPEDLFVASIASCHMLSYLALAARNGINVIEYSDRPSGTLVTGPAGGKFTEVTLHPRVVIAAGGDVDLALRLHEQAHEQCFIAASCSVPIGHEAQVDIG